METQYSQQQSKVAIVIDDLLALSRIEKSTVAQLQLRHPDMRLTLCLQDELGVQEPYMEFEQADIHLVASAPNRCSHLTSQVEAATGLLIALHE